MKIKNRLENIVLKLENAKAKKAIQNLMKKLLVSLIITTNVCFYAPPVIFAASNDSEERVPATVPAVINEIISKFVSVETYSGSSNSTSGNTITNNAESGDGWDSVTEVKASNGVTRKYRNYKQYNNGNSYWNNQYWEGNIASDACGPSSVAIVLSGYGYDSNPGDVVDVMHNVFKTDASDSFEKLIDPLKHIGNIEAEAHYGAGTTSDISIIRENFKAGRPVIINAPGHYVVYLGEDESGKLIISDPGANDGGHDRYGATLEEVISNGNITCGYILIKSDGSATSENKNNSNNDNSSNKNSNKNSNDQEKSGEAKIEKCNLSNGGYDAIFTSGTTGRQFKEYKQNSSAYSYPDISKYGCGWGSECGTVSTLIIGSGYTQNATIQDGANKLNSDTYRGGTSFSGFLSDYTGQSVTQSGVSSKEELKNAIANGSVAVIHDNGYSSAGHYMAILDINNDKNQVYISNPDVYGTGSDGIHQGWNSIDDVYNAIEKNEIYFVTNDGSTINYGAGGSTSASSSSSSVDMSGNITEITGIGRSGYKIDVDWEEEVEEILENLKKQNYKISKYLDNSNQKEFLRNYLKAVIVTQYPDLRSAKEITKDRAEIPADETQGCIKIKRFIDSETKSFAGRSLTNPVDSKDNAMYLTYMPYSKFSELIINTDKSALNYFSLDSSNNLVVAGWETLDVDVSIEQIAGDPDSNPDSAPEPRAQEYEKLIEKKINYVDQVSKYMMPFNYLWSLLVYGNDEDFVNDLAKLVIDTDIVIGCYDATNTKKTTYTNEYEKHDITEDQVYINDRTNTGNSVYVDRVYTYRVIETQVLNTDIVSINLIYADTWTATYKKDYTVKYENSNNGDGDTTTLNDVVKYQHYGQAIHEDEIKKRLENNEEAQKNVENEKQRLKEETHNYNQNRFAYRYDIINQKVSNALLKIEDVQNHLINMIIRQNTEQYIRNTFNTNEIIVDYAKELTGSDNPSNFLSSAATEANNIVRSANNVILLNPPSLFDSNNLAINRLQNSKGDSQNNENTFSKNNETTLLKQLTKDGEDESMNQTYEAKVTSIQYQDIEKRQNQKENMKMEKTTSKVVDVTTGTNQNVVMKVDKDAKEDNFVKLLYYSKRAKSNLKIIDSWLFESMEETATVADMLDLTKYLFNCVYKPNTEYTKEQLDEIANLFDPGKMSNITKKQTSGGTIVGGASYSSLTIPEDEMEVLYKLVQAEGGGGTHEQVMYITCTILNRVLSSTFAGDTVSEIAFASSQFEVTWNGMFDSAIPTSETIAAVDEALQKGDITGGAIGFQNDLLYDDQYPNQTYETPIELLRETWPSGSVVVFFTTASIQAELSQY